MLCRRARAAMRGSARDAAQLVRSPRQRAPQRNEQPAVGDDRRFVEPAARLSAASSTCHAIPYIARGQAPSRRARKRPRRRSRVRRLGDWVRFALIMLKPKGALHFVHRADRIDSLLAQLAGEPERSWFHVPGEGSRRPHLVARASSRRPARLAAVRVARADGRFTAEAEPSCARGGLVL